MIAPVIDAHPISIVIADVIGVVVAGGIATRLVTQQRRRYSAGREQVAPPTCLYAQA